MDEQFTQQKQQEEILAPQPQPQLEEEISEEDRIVKSLEQQLRATASKSVRIYIKKKDFESMTKGRLKNTISIDPAEFDFATLLLRTGKDYGSGDYIFKFEIPLKDGRITTMNIPYSIDLRTTDEASGKPTTQSNPEKDTEVENLKNELKELKQIINQKTIDDKIASIEKKFAEELQKIKIAQPQQVKPPENPVLMITTIMEAMSKITRNMIPPPQPIPHIPQQAPAPAMADMAQSIANAFILGLKTAQEAGGGGVETEEEVEEKGGFNLGKIIEGVASKFVERFAGGGQQAPAPAIAGGGQQALPTNRQSNPNADFVRYVLGIMMQYINYPTKDIVTWLKQNLTYSQQKHISTLPVTAIVQDIPQYAPYQQQLSAILTELGDSLGRLKQQNLPQPQEQPQSQPQEQPQSQPQEQPQSQSQEQPQEQPVENGETPVETEQIPQLVELRPRRGRRSSESDIIIQDEEKQ